MPRYHVVFADPNDDDNAIHGIVIRARHPVHAILQHPWIAQTYLPSYIQNNFAAEDEDNCRENIFNTTSWRVLCVDLDEAIMRDLNDGDSSVSSAMQQQ